MRKLTMSFVFYAAASIACLHAQAPKKPWTILVYMARDNSLSDAGQTNINDMKSVDNPYANILVFDSHKINGIKETQKLLITKNKISVIETIANLDSGKPETFAQALNWAVTDFPSDHLAIVAWDHGSGILNRKPGQSKGFCYDDTTNSYLDDMSVQDCMKAVVHARGGKPVDIFGFDACLMADAEIVAAFAPYASYMVASQQTVPALGWNYKKWLNWRKNLSARTLAIKIVNDYGAYYSQTDEGYTMSAIDIAGWKNLNGLINTMATQLDGLITQAADPSAFDALLDQCSNSFFEEATYMDLACFCTSLQAQLDPADSTTHPLQQTLTAILNELKTMIIANVTSKNLAQATGLSIYLPQQLVEPSYNVTYFAQQNAWTHFISHYMQAAA